MQRRSEIHHTIQHTKLGVAFATAICGNDILSSALYVSGIAVLYAGIYAPLVLALVALVLFFYKSVYTEVVEALPINGGAYNCLLNSTSKTLAAMGGMITVLSYVATAVISAITAVRYLHTILPIPIMPTVIALLLFFALLVITGIKDSAKVAFVIFAIHIVALISFVLLGLLFFLHGHSHILENIHYTHFNLLNGRGVIEAVALGFAASLLGVSGFESSANFVEEQRPGVFRKTLRNMLLGVAIFNPLIALVALNSSSIPTIIESKDFLLSQEALILGGHFFQYLIVIDAFLVLAGAVLTSYVGVSGLMYRMASDACLPEFFTKANGSGSYTRIILTFFLLCSSILFLTHGDLLALAGVYTIAFLGVMTLFALGNLILRSVRSELRRTYQAPFVFVILAFSATLFGIVGNIILDVHNLVYFLYYFIPAIAFVFVIIYEDYAVGFLLRITKGVPPIRRFLDQTLTRVTAGTYVVFLHRLYRLHDVLRYIDRNEAAKNIILVHCNNGNSKQYDASYREIEEAIPVLKKLGVFPHLNVKLMYVEEPFSPESVDFVANKLQVPKNHILIGSVSSSFPFDYADLGGVRIIF